MKAIKDSPPSSGDRLPTKTVPKYFEAYFVHPQALDRTRSEISECLAWRPLLISLVRARDCIKIARERHVAFA